MHFIFTLVCNLFPALSINMLELPGFPISVHFFLFQSPCVTATAFVAMFLRDWVSSFGSGGSSSTLIFFRPNPAELLRAIIL